MRYIASLSEINDLVELNLLRPAADIYDFHLAQVDLRQNSFIEPLGQNMGRFGKHDLIMDPETASWALMDERETDLYRSLQHASFSEHIQRLRVPSEDILVSFLKALYRRGLVSLDGQYAFRRDMYRDGFPYHDALLVELLVTERCNLACAYCQARASAQKQDMPERVAMATVERAFELDHATILFELSGGEPLINFGLVGKTVDLIERRAAATGKSVIIALVTNGTLLRPEMAEFVKEHGIKLAISLDGPAEIHRMARPSSGATSRGQVLEPAVSVLKNYNLPFGVLVTVSRHNSEHATEIVRYLAELDPHSVKVNPVARVGRAAHQVAIGVSGAEYLAFMKVVFDHMVGDGMVVREFNISEMVNRLTTRYRDYRCMRAHCNAGITYLVVDPLGRIFPCAQMTGYAHAELGNVLQLPGRLDEVALRNKFMQRFSARRMSDMVICCGCGWRRFCEGGCIAELLDDPQTEINSVRTPNCDFYRGMYNYIMETLSLRPTSLDTYLKSENFRYAPGQVVDEDFADPSRHEQT